jgi:hypothetical protein
MLFPRQYFYAFGVTNLLPAADHAFRSLFLTRPQIVTCRQYCSYQYHLNVHK